MSLQFERCLSHPSTALCDDQAKLAGSGKDGVDQMICRAPRAQDQTSKFIAIIEDDDGVRDSLGDLLEAAGLVAQCFRSANEFLASGLRPQPACLITDIPMPKMSGLEFQTRLKDAECDIPIIFISADDDARTQIQPLRDGVVEFLTKPFDHHLLLKKVRDALAVLPTIANKSRHVPNTDFRRSLCNRDLPWVNQTEANSPEAQILWRDKS